MTTGATHDFSHERITRVFPYLELRLRVRVPRQVLGGRCRPLGVGLFPSVRPRGARVFSEDTPPMPRKTAAAESMQAQLGFDFGFNQTADTIEALNAAVNQDEEDDFHVEQQPESRPSPTAAVAGADGGSEQGALHGTGLEDPGALGGQLAGQAAIPGRAGDDRVREPVAGSADARNERDRERDAGGRAGRDGDSADARDPYRALTPVDFRIDANTVLGKGGPKAKFRDNLRALAVLRTLAADQRPATPDEQQQLAQYVGWGGLPQAFDRQNAEWANESASLAEALSEDDYARARRSTQDAHYTPLAVVRAIYAGLERLGFGGGRILEAGAGTGHFIGSLPDTMREQSRFTAIELDPTTASVGQRLYPSATYINRGYEAVHIPNGHFDAVVVNPPFGQQTLYDPQHRELKDFSIHNYFIAKSIEALRPGGVLAVVVSRYFMDAANTTVREHIADRAHLLGAIRLPNTAFKENALTEVTTDVVFFQRCKEGETTNRRWIEVEPLIDYESNSEIPVNRYFVDHPRQMLGHMALVSGPHGERAELLPSRTGNLESDLAAALRILPENVYSAVKQELQADTAEEKPELTLPETLKVGSYFVTPDGKLARRLCDVLEKHDYAFVDPRNEKAGERIRGMVRVRDVLRELMRAELDDLPGGQILQLRDTLNRAYDVFVQRYGHLSSQANRLAMSEDPEYPLLFALERDYDKGITPETARKHGVQPRAPKATKAAIFQRRVLSPREEVTYVETAKDALVVSMNQRGRVDMDYVMRLCRQSEAEIVKELAGHIYRDPVKKEWLTADQYLSGNVKSKLAAATAAAATSAEYLGNVDALKAIQPADIDAIDIAVQLGSTWVPADDVKEFVRHLL